jgi:hypothetical protein
MNSGTGWSRYGSQYRRLCARAGCGAPAVTTLRFQSTERQAWLVELDDNAARTQGDLCQRHAAALVLPRGWDLHDERASSVAAVVEAEAPAAKTGNGNGSRRAKARRKEAIEPAPDAHRLPGLEAAPGSDPAGDDETAGNDAQPRSALVPFGAGDEEEVDDALEAILDARTPLLQRAFRNARPH